MRRYMIVGLGLFLGLGAACASKDRGNAPGMRPAALPRGVSDPPEAGPMDHLFPFLADPADSSGTRRAGRDDLVLSVALPKKEYRKYEPVVFTLGVANQAKDIVNAVLPIWPTTRLLTIELKKDGKAFAQQLKWSGFGSAEVFRIPAGQAVRIELDLSALYPNGLEPGTYSLKVTYTHETLVLPAGEAPFTVTTAAADDEAAAKDLQAAYQSGGVQAFLGVIERHRDSVLVPQVRLELIHEYKKAKQPYSCVAQCRMIEQSPWATARMKLSALYQTVFALEEGGEYLLALRYLRQVPGSDHRLHIAQLQAKAKGMVDARIREAERNIQQRAVEIVVHQNAQPQKFVFAVPRMEPSRYPWITHCQIAADEANRILGILIDSGFFEKADSFDMAEPRYPLPAVSVRAHTGKGFYEQNIGWGSPAAAVLANLRKAVKDGTDSAHAMDKVLEAVRMERPTTQPATQPEMKSARVGAPAFLVRLPQEGVYETGDWRYEYRQAGHQRHNGRLTFKDKPIVGAEHYDRVETPWGTLIYLGPDAGFLPTMYRALTLEELKRGRDLTPPEGRPTQWATGAATQPVRDVAAPARD